MVEMVGLVIITIGSLFLDEVMESIILKINKKIYKLKPYFLLGNQI